MDTQWYCDFSICSWPISIPERSRPFLKDFHINRSKSFPANCTAVTSLRCAWEHNQQRHVCNHKPTRQHNLFHWNHAKKQKTKKKQHYTLQVSKMTAKMSLFSPWVKQTKCQTFQGARNEWAGRKENSKYEPPAQYTSSDSFCADPARQLEPFKATSREKLSNGEPPGSGME